MKSNRLSSGLVCVLALLLAGCPSNEGGDDEIALENLGDELVSTYCTLLVDCGSYPDRATCEASALDMGSGVEQMEASVAAGRLTYDGAKAAECLASFPATCEINVMDEDSIGSEACEATFTGTVALGGACYESEECANDGDCDTSACLPDVQCCAGVCVAGDVTPVVGIGEDCSAAQCVDGAYCASDDLGNQTCAAQVAAGGTCHSPYSSECVDGTMCNYDYTTQTGTCVAPAAEGTTCVPTMFFACARLDNWCDPADSTCKKRLGVGQACNVEVSNCLAYTYCDLATALCVERPDVGESCTSQTGCLGTADCSDAGVCVADEPDPVCP